MKKLLFFVALVVLTAGCSNPIKKSITEELSLEEIKSISKKDPLFLAFYDRYFENKCYEHFLTNKTVQVMYSDITYKRFYKYIKKINDDDFTNAIYEEWNEKFGYTEQKFDSIIDYWQVKTDADAYNLYQIYLNKLYAENMPYEIWQYFYQETHHESSIDEKIAIIKRYIDENYVSWDEYKTTLQNMRMEEIDPMCYNFQKFIVDCKKAL